MPIRWTTPEEFKFLQGEKKVYLTIPSAQKWLFWDGLYERWQIEFPEAARLFPNVDVLTDEQKITVEVEKAKRKFKLRTWFTNNTKADTRTTNRNAPAAHIKVEDALKPTRNLQETEMYSRMYYEDKVKMRVENEIAVMKTPVSKKARVDVVCRALRESYATESDEVKREVKAAIKDRGEARQKARERAQKELDSPISAQEMQENLRSIYKELDAFFASVWRRTGWYFSVVGGGLIPGVTGRDALRCITYHYGRDRHGHHWGQVYPDFAENVQGQYGDYIEDIFVPSPHNADTSGKTTRAPVPEMTQKDLERELDTGSPAPDPSQVSAEASTSTAPHPGCLSQTPAPIASSQSSKTVSSAAPSTSSEPRPQQSTHDALIDPCGPADPTFNALSTVSGQQTAALSIGVTPVSGLAHTQAATPSPSTGSVLAANSNPSVAVQNFASPNWGTAASQPGLVDDLFGPLNYSDAAMFGSQFSSVPFQNTGLPTCLVTEHI
ncbi:hypothetical protein CERSUDRAFT_89800 [Gelatoporia subvermispora B]|uniref:Uncharacterized protein n=1 Tax=Ceriporiopsis subvermispora (strain B) TaxID=914234 RepID=M2PWL1_CERS8|nr:hypothetical protein CERSUDRAFT_89800 [Gelatoporia subvermispora B]